MKTGLDFTRYSTKRLEDLHLTKEQILYVILNGVPIELDEEFLQFTWKGIEVTTCLELKTVYTIQKYDVSDGSIYEDDRHMMEPYNLAMCA